MSNLEAIRIKLMQMTVLIIAAVVLSSCGDMFSTKSVSPKPEDINQYNGLFTRKENILYKMDEWILHNNSDSVQVTSQNVEFIFLSETVVDSKTWSQFEMNVTDFDSGDTLYQKTFLGRIDSSGIRFFQDTSVSGPRFFLLKSNRQNSQNKAEFETLPNLLLAQSNGSFSSGVLTFERQVAGLDTLIFHESLEEAWLINETVLFNGVSVVTATYTYGQSGLLSCIQIFAGFEHYNRFGDNLGSGKIKRVFTLI